MGFFGVLTLILITLKLLGVIAWSWIWVLAALWVPLAIFVIIMVLTIIAAVVVNLARP